MNGTGRLMTFDATQQHYGTWLAGYHWNIYGCGTFRNPVSAVGAQVFFNRFVEKLGRKLHTSMSYAAALEHRPSGLDPSIPRHWHFVAGCSKPDGMVAVARELWNKHFGNAKVDAYDPNQDGAFYISKLAAHDNGGLLLDNLNLLQYNGPLDLVAAMEQNPYVPDHLKNVTHGKYLVVR